MSMSAMMRFEQDAESSHAIPTSPPEPWLPIARPTRGQLCAIGYMAKISATRRNAFLHRRLRSRAAADDIGPGSRPDMRVLDTGVSRVEYPEIRNRSQWTHQLALSKSCRGIWLALHALYEMAHRIAFTLIMRITANREIAEEL